MSIDRVVSFAVIAACALGEVAMPWITDAYWPMIVLALVAGWMALNMPAK